VIRAVAGAAIARTSSVEPTSPPSADAADPTRADTVDPLISRPKERHSMYRGSRLAASFLLFLTGSAATAIGLDVAPAAVGGAWPLALLVIVFGVAHFAALFGIARGREWGRQLAITIAEIGGGVSFAGLFAIALGANPFGGQSVANGTGLVAWTLAMYLLLGISAGRVQFDGWRRRSAWWPTPLLRVGI
jgi:hypothetical protein